MPAGTWLSRDEASALLEQQAQALARKLGHSLGPWNSLPVNAKPVLAKLARCATCWDYVAVRIRSLVGTPVSGGAVTFRCGGVRLRPAPPAPADLQD